MSYNAQRNLDLETAKNEEIKNLQLKLANALVRIVKINGELNEAREACDLWEERNGDAPHRAFRLADRILVNAGIVKS